MGDANTIANQFVQHYYQTMGTNRAGLASLYVRDAYSPSPPCAFLIAWVLAP
jgi:hypothetical protein